MMELPIAETHTKESLMSHKNNIKTSQGLYFLYDKDNVLLYIGWARTLNERVKSHIKGWTHTNFSNEIHTIKILDHSDFEGVFNQFDYHESDIERGLVRLMKPKYNVKFNNYGGVQ